MSEAAGRTTSADTVKKQGEDSGSFHHLPSQLASLQMSPQTWLALSLSRRF